MSVHTLLNSFRRDPLSEGLRLERLLQEQRAAAHAGPGDGETGRERRSEARFNVDTECAVCVIVGKDDDPINGVLRDVSRSGLGVVLPRPVSEGAEVMVRFGRVVVFGHVAFALDHSVDHNGAFYAGITLRHVFEIRENPGESLVREL